VIFIALNNLAAGIVTVSDFKDS